MTFSMQLSEDVIEVRDWVHQFAADVVRPAAAEWDEREETPWPVIQEAAKVGLYSPELFAQQTAEPTGLGWNGGTAVGSAAGRVYLAYPGAGALGAVDAATLTNVLWVAAAPGVLTPVLGVDETANVVATGDVAAVVFLHAANTGAFLGGVGIPAPATAIVGPGPVGNRLYVSQAAGGVVSVIDSFAGVVVGGVGVAGASAEFATSP